MGPSSTRASSRFIDSEATAPPPPPGLDLTAHTQALILGLGMKSIRSGIRGARSRNHSPSCRLKGGCGAAPHSHCVAHFLGNSSTFLQSLSVPPTTHLASACAIFPRRSSSLSDLLSSPPDSPPHRLLNHSYKTAEFYALISVTRRRLSQIALVFKTPDEGLSAVSCVAADHYTLYFPREALFKPRLMFEE